MKVSSVYPLSRMLSVCISPNYERSFDTVSLYGPTGELKEIKQDISSLRYELLERENHDMETLTDLIRQLGEVLHVRQKEEQRHKLSAHS